MTTFICTFDALNIVFSRDRNRADKQHHSIIYEYVYMQIYVIKNKIYFNSKLSKMIHYFF